MPPRFRTTGSYDRIRYARFRAPSQILAQEGCTRTVVPFPTHRRLRPNPSSSLSSPLRILAWERCIAKNNFDFRSLPGSVHVSPVRLSVPSPTVESCDTTCNATFDAAPDIPCRTVPERIRRSVFSESRQVPLSLVRQAPGTDMPKTRRHCPPVRRPSSPLHSEERQNRGQTRRTARTARHSDFRNRGSRAEAMSSNGSPAPVVFFQDRPHPRTFYGPSDDKGATMCRSLPSVADPPMTCGRSRPDIGPETLMPNGKAHGQPTGRPTHRQETNVRHSLPEIVPSHRYRTLFAPSCSSPRRRPSPCRNTSGRSAIERDRDSPHPSPTAKDRIRPVPDRRNPATHCRRAEATAVSGPSPRDKRESRPRDERSPPPPFPCRRFPTNGMTERRKAASGHEKGHPEIPDALSCRRDRRDGRTEEPIVLF